MNSNLFDVLFHRLEPLTEHVRKNEPFYLIITLLIPVIILMGLTIKPIMTLQFGETVQLQTLPVDPTDLFRGDYIDLFYDMNQISVKETPIEHFPSDYTVETLRGKDIYVSLVPIEGQKTYEVTHYSMTKPSGDLYLKGQIRYAYNNGISPSKDNIVLNIDFGVDRYFIEENTGSSLDSATRDGKVLVTLKIYKGFGVVTNLEIQK